MKCHTVQQIRETSVVNLLNVCDTLFQTDPTIPTEKVFQQLLRPFQRTTDIRQVPALILRRIRNRRIIWPQFAEDCHNVSPVLRGREGEKPSISDGGRKQGNNV